MALFSEAQIGQLRFLMAEVMAPVVERIDALDGAVKALGRQFTKLNALQHNSTLGRSETLMIVPRDGDGVLPDVEFPQSLEVLLVAGNEALPSGPLNSWNKKKSIALLRFYGEQDDTDNEDENTSRSRHRSLRLARKIGVTQTQLNFGQLTL